MKKRESGKIFSFEENAISMIDVLLAYKKYIKKIPVITERKPRGAYFERVNKEKIKEIQHKINRRPRLPLNFEKPKSLFYKFAS